MHLPQIKSKNILIHMPLSLCTIHFAAPIITIRVKSISVSAENTSEDILLTQHDYMGLSWCCFRSVMRVMGTINLKCRYTHFALGARIWSKTNKWKWRRGHEDNRLRKWERYICCQIATNLFTKLKLLANKWENWFFF